MRIPGENYSKPWFCLLTCLLIGLSCQSQEKNNKKHFTYDIPKYIDKEGLIKKRQVDSMIGLKSLEKGFDGICIRIWLSHSLKGENMIELINENNSWIGYRYKLKFKYDTVHIFKLNGIVANKTDFIPPGGWSDFINQLNKQNISALPDFDTIYQQPAATDGYAIIVDYAGKNIYRLYHYENFVLYKNKYPEAKNISNIYFILQKAVPGIPEI